MTQENIMTNLEIWVRQVTGELNVKEIFFKEKPEEEEINEVTDTDLTTPYYLYFSKFKQTARLIAATNRNRKSPCNIEFIWNRSGKLKGVRLLGND